MAKTHSWSSFAECGGALAGLKMRFVAMLAAFFEEACAASNSARKRVGRVGSALKRRSPLATQVDTNHTIPSDYRAGLAPPRASSPYTRARTYLRYTRVSTYSWSIAGWLCVLAPCCPPPRSPHDRLARARSCGCSCTCALLIFSLPAVAVASAASRRECARHCTGVLRFKSSAEEPPEQRLATARQKIHVHATTAGSTG